MTTYTHQTAPTQSRDGSPFLKASEGLRCRRTLNNARGARPAPRCERQVPVIVSLRRRPRGR
jgi:hypothetical protein